MTNIAIFFKQSIQYFISISFLFMIMISATAQQTKMDITGVYFMSGVRETASVLELKADSSFEFFFSQGALDRGGQGKWAVKDGRLILNTTGKRPEKDYALVSSKAVPGNATVIKMVDKNSMILSYSEVTIKTASASMQESTNSHGEIRFPLKHAMEIALLFRLCPDRESVFNVNKAHNYFEFRLEPWIAEVFFQDFSLQVGEGVLTGAHPLLQGPTFLYEKEKK